MRPAVVAALPSLLVFTVSCAPTSTALPTPEPTGSAAVTQVAPVPTVPQPSERTGATPCPTIEPTIQPLVEREEETDAVRFTILYDNNAHDPALETDWGFACLAELDHATVLFDTGGDGPTLLDNMETLGVDPQAIDAVALSHNHGDHTGGLDALLDTGARPTVYVPASFPSAFKRDVAARTELVEVTGPAEILAGVHTTGEIGSSIVEQALVVETDAGPVVLTGCAHPGIVSMVRGAKEVAPGDVALVVGGFHLRSASRRRVGQIIDALRELGVERVAPTHCTGDEARQMFAEAFGDDCTLAGVGQTFRIGGRGE